MKALRVFQLLTLALFLTTVPTMHTQAAGPSVTYLTFAGGGCNDFGAGFAFVYQYDNIVSGSDISWEISAPNNSHYSDAHYATIPTGSGTTIHGYTNFFPNTFPSTPFDMQWTALFHNPDDSVFGSIPFILHCNPISGDFSVTIGIIGGSSGPEPALFMDGRQNKNDAGQTAAVYCNVPEQGDVRVYALYHEVGYLAFTVTKAQLEAGNQHPSVPYLIRATKGAELYRLPDGSLRIQRGTYIFDWSSC